MLVFGGREMAAKRGDSAQIMAAEFDDRRGGFWQLDLVELYDGAKRVCRTVVHLNPAVVVVLDEAVLDREEEISLRWHTVDRCGPDREGRFCVESGKVRLAARVVRLDGPDISCERNEHEYRPPYDRYRLGTPLKQRHESFIEAKLRGSQCRLFSLFAVFPPGEEAKTWEESDDGWVIETPDGSVVVEVDSNALEVVNERSRLAWRVRLR